MAKKSTGPLRRTIELVIVAKPQLSGLTQSIRLMQTLRAEAEKTSAALGRMTQGISGPQILSRIKSHQTKGGGLSPRELGKLFGVSEREMDRFTGDMAKRFRTNFRQGQFRSAAGASGAEGFMREVLRQRNDLATRFGRVVSGATSASQESIGAKTAEGILTQLEKIATNIAGKTSGPAGPARTRGPVRKGGGGPGAAVPLGAHEIGRTVTETADYTRTVIETAGKLGDTVLTTFDESLNQLKQVTKTKGQQAAIKNIQHRKALVKAALAADKSARKGDPLGLANLQEEAAKQVEGILTGDLRQAMGPDQYRMQAERIKAEAENLRGQAKANRQRALRTVMSGATLGDVRASGLSAAEERAAQEEAARARQQNVRSRQAQQKFAGRNAAVTAQVKMQKELHETRLKAEADNEKRIREEQQHAEQLRARQQKVFDKAVRGGTPPVLPGGAGRGGAALGLGQRMLGNTMKVGMWALSAIPVSTAIYGGMQAAAEALKTVLETGLQTQRLSQVFRGVGGSAKELTMDVLDLASAEGRSRDEAMESAISWSRLGLTRREVNEAVRQSLIAANVAEMEAGEATTHLQAIMAAYGLQVRDLQVVLGQLNETSNTFNVTNQDLLTGISRVASVAKQAGLPLQELIGILAAGVGTTGQTGANIGNALKSVIVSLGNPEIQKFLRTQYKLEVTAQGGNEMKSFSQVLAELWTTYQKLNSAQKQQLLQQVAGKTQASRLAAILDSYVKGQVLAINAQLNLNSAEEENAKIKASLISKLRGLKTEWDKFIVSGNELGGVTEGLGQLVEGLGGVLRIAELIGKTSFFGSLPKGSFAAGLKGAFPFLHLLDLGNLIPKPKDRQKELEQAELQARARVNAGHEAVNLLETARGGLKASDEAGRKKMIEQLSKMGLIGDQTGFRYNLTKAGNNPGAIDAVIEKAKKEVREKIQEAAGEATFQYNQQLAELRYGISGSQTDEGRKDLEKQYRALVAGKRDALIAEFSDENAFQETEESMARAAQHMQKTKDVLSQVVDLYRNIPAETLTQRNEYELKSLSAQREYLQSRIAGLGASDLTDVAKARINSELVDQLRQVEAEQASRNSPQVQGLLRRGDRAGLSRELALSQADRFTFGESRMDQLNNRLGGINKLLAAQEQLAAHGRSELQRENALASAQALKAEKIRTQIELERERGRLMQQEFEFSRKLLTSGPNELLQRVIAMRAVQRGGINSGQFLGFSPEMREAILDAEQSRRRRAFLRAAPGAEEFQNNILGRVQNPVARGNFGAAAQLSESLNAAAVDLGNFRGEANQTTEAMAGLREEVSALRDELGGLRGVQGGWNGTGETGAPKLAQAYG